MALGEFITAWVLLETMLNDLVGSDDAKSQALPALLRQLDNQGLISPDQHTELNLMRELRNQVLHRRADDIPPERLTEAAARLRDLTADLKRRADGS